MEINLHLLITHLTTEQIDMFTSLAGLMLLVADEKSTALKLITNKNTVVMKLDDDER